MEHHFSCHIVDLNSFLFRGGGVLLPIHYVRRIAVVVQIFTRLDGRLFRNNGSSGEQLYYGVKGDVEL